MIVAETEAGYQFVTQPDHAALAGQFADRWGTDAFVRPEPFGPLALAAYAHDTGWRDYDRHPRLGDDGEPIDFRGMPPEPWIDLYDEGIEAVAATDAYAGLLVSLHGAGLRNQRYGRSPAWPETPPAFESFVAREERRQTDLLDRLLDAERRSEAAPLVTEADRRLLRSLHGSKTVPEDYDGRLWPDYQRLQAWDELSLAFCITDDPPGYDAVGGVPGSGPQDERTLSLTRVEDDEYRIDPYPFDAPAFEATLPVRRVDAAAATDEASLRDAYYEAGRETRTVTIRRE